MKGDIDLLNEVYSGSELAREILSHLIRSSEDEDFRRLLAEQFAEYHRIMLAAEERLSAEGYEAKRASRVSRMPIFSGMRLNLALDHTSSHMAEMLIQGHAMGLIDISRALNSVSGASLSTRALAKRLIAASESDIGVLLGYV